MSKQKISTGNTEAHKKLRNKSKFNSFSHKIFRKTAMRLIRKWPQLSNAVLKTGSRAPPEHYFSAVILISILTIPIALIGILISVITGQAYVLILLPIPALVFVGGLFKPFLSHSSKSKAIDTELPYVISYFSLLSGGGISLLVTLRRISRVGLFPVLSREAKIILTDVDMAGTDPVSAIERSARRTPNKYLANFFSGYSTLMRAGGRLSNYMDAKTREIFTQRIDSMESSSGTISIFAEAYIAATVVMGLCFYLIFTLQSVVNQTGLSGLSNAVFFSTVFIPLISIVFFYLVDAVQLKEEPISSIPHLKIIFISLIAVPIIVFFPIDLPLYLSIGIGLMISSIPPMITYERELRQKKSIENMLPIFMRDMAEVRKTGLSPEKCIEQISKRDYGTLSKYISKMSAQIGWGVPIRRVMENFANNVQVWSAKTVSFLLLEVVDLGGGTVKMFENIAEFTQRMKEISQKQRSTLKPLILVPYFGAVMMVVSSMMMMGFIIGPSAGETGSEASFISVALLTGAVFQAWIMGFASGKMGEGSMGAGFKHAIAMVAVSILSIFIMNLVA